MAEADMGFELGLKKKKKKVKKLVALDGEDEPSTAAAPVAEASEPPAEAPVEDDGALPDFGKKKKKKKKKKAFAFDLEAAEALEAQAAGAAGGDEPASQPDVDVAAALQRSGTDDFTFPEKKKAKRPKVAEEFAQNDVDATLMTEVLDATTTAALDGVQEPKKAYEMDDRDYHYSELLERVFDIMRQKNPQMLNPEKKRFVMKPPQVIRLGSKKSGFINFIEICKLMHRQHEHVLGFLLAELGTSGTLDGTNTLVLKGRFQQKQMETVLRRYIREYVTCHTCKSPDTILAKENRIFFLTCETCGARKSVASISAGFQATVGKRSRIRAAAAAAGR